MLNIYGYIIFIYLIVFILLKSLKQIILINIPCTYRILVNNFIRLKLYKKTIDFSADDIVEDVMQSPKTVRKSFLSKKNEKDKQKAVEIDLLDHKQKYEKTLKNHFNKSFRFNKLSCGSEIEINISKTILRFTNESRMRSSVAFLAWYYFKDHDFSYKTILPFLHNYFPDSLKIKLINECNIYKIDCLVVKYKSLIDTLMQYLSLKEGRSKLFSNSVKGVLELSQLLFEFKGCRISEDHILKDELYRIEKVSNLLLGIFRKLVTRSWENFDELMHELPDDLNQIFSKKIELLKGYNNLFDRIYSSLTITVPKNLTLNSFKEKGIQQFDYLDMSSLQSYVSEYETHELEFGSNEMTSLINVCKYLLSLYNAIKINNWFKEDNPNLLFSVHSSSSNQTDLSGVSVSVTELLKNKATQTEYWKRFISHSLPDGFVYRVEHLLVCLSNECEIYRIDKRLRIAISSSSEYLSTKDFSMIKTDMLNTAILSFRSHQNVHDQDIKNLIASAECLLSLRSALKIGDWDTIRSIIKSNPITTPVTEAEINKIIELSSDAIALNNELSEALTDGKLTGSLFDLNIHSININKLSKAIRKIKGYRDLAVEITISKNPDIFSDLLSLYFPGEHFPSNEKKLIYTSIVMILFRTSFLTKDFESLYFYYNHIDISDLSDTVSEEIEVFQFQFTHYIMNLNIYTIYIYIYIYLYFS